MKAVGAAKVGVTVELLRRLTCLIRSMCVERINGRSCCSRGVAVVVADIEVEGEYQFERRRFGANPEQLQALCTWLTEHRGVTKESRRL